MNITTAIHAYNVGNLEGFSTLQLNELGIILEQKITYMNQVIRGQEVSQDVRDDLRKYRLVSGEIAKLINRRIEPVCTII